MGGKGKKKKKNQEIKRQKSGFGGKMLKSKGSDQKQWQ